jgi:hypothetical protein
MKEIFADTFYFLALLSPSDAAYERARAITAGQPSRLVTTAWVLTELANGLSKREMRAGFLNTFDALQSHPAATICEPDRRLYDAGIELYRARPDKDWSLTDCISFVVMHDRGINDALTGDHHFEQAGFRALLRAE